MEIRRCSGHQRLGYSKSIAAIAQLQPNRFRMVCLTYRLFGNRRICMAKRNPANVFLRKEKPVSLLAHSGQYISRPPHRRRSKGKEILLRTPSSSGLSS